MSKNVPTPQDRDGSSHRNKNQIIFSLLFFFFEIEMYDAYFLLLLCLCMFVCLLGIYFFTIVQALVEWGYTRDDDVRGAPYDWRKAPSKQPCTHTRTQNQACTLESCVWFLSQEAVKPALITHQTCVAHVVAPLKERSAVVKRSCWWLENLSVVWVLKRLTHLQKVTHTNGMND